MTDLPRGPTAWFIDAHHLAAVDFSNAQAAGYHRFVAWFVLDRRCLCDRIAALFGWLLGDSRDRPALVEQAFASYVS